MQQGVFRFTYTTGPPLSEDDLEDLDFDIKEITQGGEGEAAKQLSQHAMRPWDHVLLVLFCPSLYCADARLYFCRLYFLNCWLVFIFVFFPPFFNIISKLLSLIDLWKIFCMSLASFHTNRFSALKFWGQCQIWWFLFLTGCWLFGFCSILVN